MHASRLTCLWRFKGMGVPTVTAARILKGQLSGHPGEETVLEMDKFPFVALSKVIRVALSITEMCRHCSL